MFLIKAWQGFEFSCDSLVISIIINALARDETIGKGSSNKGAVNADAAATCERVPVVGCQGKSVRSLCYIAGELEYSTYREIFASETMAAAKGIEKTLIRTGE